MEEHDLGRLAVQVLHTPGHAPGHVVFHLAEHEVLFAGDLLFRGSIGRTDFPGCDRAKMDESLRRVMQLPRDTRVFPGHMDATSIGVESQSNPFVSAL